MQEELATLQRRIKREEVTAHSLNQEKEINVRILKATRQEEEECRLKSRQLWLKGGDYNTEYFHKQAKARLSFNIIKELKDDDGQKIEGQEKNEKSCTPTLLRILHR